MSPKHTATSTARVFWSGRSQAVRLPKEYRFEGSVVAIHREGRRVVLEAPEVERDRMGWPKGYWTHMSTVDPGFDVGPRNVPHERADPLATKSKR